MQLFTFEVLLNLWHKKSGERYPGDSTWCILLADCQALRDRSDRKNETRVLAAKEMTQFLAETEALESC